MIYATGVVLTFLWFLGIVTEYTMGGLIHFLLVIAVIMFLVDAVQGRRAYWRDIYMSK